jgi:hypothetical protein
MHCHKHLILAAFICACTSGLPDLFWHTIPKWGKYTKLALHKLPNRHKIYQMTIIYSKWLQNIPSFPIQRSSKIYSNKDFWFENIPSGSPGVHMYIRCIEIFYNTQSSRFRNVNNAN